MNVLESHVYCFERNGIWYWDNGIECDSPSHRDHT